MGGHGDKEQTLKENVVILPPLLLGVLFLISLPHMRHAQIGV